MSALNQLFEQFMAGTVDHDAFATWRGREGAPLQTFATYCALAEVLGGAHPRPDRGGDHPLPGGSARLLCGASLRARWGTGSSRTARGGARSGSAAREAPWAGYPRGRGRAARPHKRNS